MNAQELISVAANKKNRGFTLIELIVYIGLLVIFLTGAVYFAWNTILISQKSNVQEEVTANIRFASERISSEIRNSSGINSVTSNSISLSNTDASRNPTVFDVSGGRLRIGFGSGGSCPSTSPCFLTSNKVNVSQLLFENLSVAGVSRNIKFTITVNSIGTRSEWQKSESYSETAEVRSR